MHLIESTGSVPDRLRQWSEVAAEALSPATLRAYRTDSAAFAAWCADRGVTSLPASAESVAAFLRSDPALAVATVRRRAATISRMHRAAGLSSPCDDEIVRLTLKGIARTRGTDQRQAAALTQRDADVLRATIGEGPKAARDLALVLVGRDLLARASELVALEVEHVEFTADGALVALRRRKTSTESHTHYIGPEAAHALRQWIEVAGITEGPAFQSITRSGRATGRALSTRDVGRILKARAQGARLAHANAVSGHSMRVGMAVDLVAADMDLPSVMQAGGWSTPRMVARYSERLTAGRGAVARYHGRR